MSLLKKSLKSSISFFALLLGLLLLPIQSHATYAPSLKWHTIETAHFLIHYHTGLKYAADEIASLTPEVHKEITEFFNWVPRDKTHIVLSNMSESPNGFASVLPYNSIQLLMSPPSDAAGLEDYQNWKKLLLRHEYVHIVNLDKAADLSLDGRMFLGRFFLFFPNTFLPRWMSEGMATFIETDNQLETGRGQSSYYRGLMRNELIHGFKSLNQINQNRSEWPSGTGSYLYGVYFYNFIRDTYGEEKISEFVEQYSHSPIPYFINIVAKQTFGKNMFALWDDFEMYLNHEFSIDVTEDQKSSRNRNRNISNTGYYSGFSQILNGKLYYIRSNRENLKELVELDIAAPEKKKKERIITKIIKQDYIFPQSFDIHPEKGILIPLLEKYENFQESFDLYTISLNTGKKTRLTKNKRYNRATWNKAGDKIIALGNINGKHKLDLLNNKGEFIKTLWKGESGTAINAFDWSPVDDKLIVSLFTPDKGWNLTLFDINNTSWHAVTNNSSIEMYPKFNKNGTHITYSADYNGIYNAYQLSLTSHEITQLTDSKSIALFPVTDEKNSEQIYFTELDKNGFNVKAAKALKTSFNKKKIPKQTPEFFQASITKDKVKEQSTKPYNGIPYLSPSWILPVYIVDTNQSSYGLFSSSNDPLNWHNYKAQILFDTKNDELRWNISYLNQKNAVYYQINSRQESFNSTHLWRQDSETSIAFILPYLKQRYSWQIFSSLQYVDTLLSLPNTPISLKINDYNFTAGVSLDTTSNNLLAVAAHDGIKTSISYEINEIETSIVQQSRIFLYSGFFSPPLKRAVFEASGSLVAAGNNARNTYLGGAVINEFSKMGFGKNTFSLYGYGLNQFIDTNMQKLSLKMHYPLYYPDTGFMRPPFGVNRFNLNMMAEKARVGSFSNINKQQWLGSVAIEININANFGFGRYPFDLTAGLAKGLNKKLGESIAYYSTSLNF